MTWRLVEAKRVLQAGHWKSLKTSMIIGAFLEPKATCGSMSGTAEDWPALRPSADTSTTARKAKPSANALTLRRRSTQSSSDYLYNPELYNPEPNENITCDLLGNEALAA